MSDTGLSISTALHVVTVAAAAVLVVGLAYRWTSAPVLRLIDEHSDNMRGSERRKRQRELAPEETVGESAFDYIPTETESSSHVFPLLCLTEQVVFLDVCKFLPAISIARLKAACRGVRDSLNTDDAVSWVVESRDWRNLERIHRVGDLPLTLPAGEWSLERLHLAENPPRFRALKFDFASHILSRDGPEGSVMCLEEVAQLMHKHQGIRLKVTGYAQPDAPPFIAHRLSAARAAMAVLYLTCRLLGIGVSNSNINTMRSLLIRNDSDGGGIAAYQSQEEQLRAHGFVLPIPRLLTYESDSDLEDVEDDDAEEMGGTQPEDGHAGRDGTAFRRVDVPPEWSLGASHPGSGKLWELAPLQTQLVGCDSLRARLLSVLARFEQAAAGGSTPLNTNWELEYGESDLSADRRVEFSLISI